MTQILERRRYPRVERNLSIKLHNEDFDIVAQTKNISVNGICVEIDRNIPIMTKLAVVVMLPVTKRRVERIECEGIVARSCQAVDINNPANFIYSIAIFFNKISNNDAVKISKYVAKYLSCLDNCVR